MALKKCKECGHQVSTQAKTCPECGARVKRPGIIAWFFAIIIGLFAFGMVKSCNQAYDTQHTAAVTAHAKAQAKPAEVPHWEYQHQTDQMTGGAIEGAVVNSKNTFELDFPYTGQQRATLVLRKHPRAGTDVILSIAKGQFQCSSYDDCSILVRFDNGKARTFKAREPQDNSSDTLFIHPVQTFIRDTQKADQVTIEATFFQQGTRTLVFDTSGLKWPPPNAKK